MLYTLIGSGLSRIRRAYSEFGNHPMEDRAIVERLAGLRAVGERDKIFDGFRSLIGEQTDFEFSFRRVEQSVYVVSHVLRL